MCVVGFPIQPPIESPKHKLSIPLIVTFGKELILQEYIYNSFLFITLGSFGISEVGKVLNKNKKEEK